MSLLKTTFTRALSLVPGTVLMKSDTVNIPTAGSLIRSATVTSFAANKLIDTNANFLSTGTNPLNVNIGDIIWNTTSASGGVAVVTGVDSATQLSISSFIIGALDSYRIYNASDYSFGPVQGCNLYFGTGGTVRVITMSGDDVTFTVIAGQVLPVQVIRLMSSTTNITSGIVALW